MKIENVFYGFTKDFKERLLLKKNKIVDTDNGVVEYYVYYDLETNEELDYGFVELNTLKSISELIDVKKRISKRKVVNAYQLDRNTPIDISGAFYGDLIKLESKFLFESKDILLKKNILFARIDDPEGKVLEITTGEKYPRCEKVRSGVCVRENRPVKDYFSDVVLPKRKVLELQRKNQL